jgi:hypothetical protein
LRRQPKKLKRENGKVFSKLILRANLKRFNLCKKLFSKVPHPRMMMLSPTSAEEIKTCFHRNLQFIIQLQLDHIFQKGCPKEQIKVLRILEIMEITLKIHDTQHSLHWMTMETTSSEQNRFQETLYLIQGVDRIEWEPRVMADRFILND